MNPVHIIGTGQGKKDLTPEQIKIIETADLLVGGTRQLALFPDHGGEILKIKGSIPELIERISFEMKTRKIVVLSSGDPMFHGIGATLARHIDRENLVILPNISSVSAAFAAIGQPWHDARLISLHGRSGPTFKFSSLKNISKAAFLTDKQKGPQFIAARLIDEELTGFKICVLENLGSPEQEKIKWFEDYHEMEEKSFSDPNIVILLRNQTLNRDVPHGTYIGMEEGLFQHTKGLITKSEVRAISLSKLKLMKKDHILWDIGSGSGSVSIEASLQIPWGQVFSVEKNPERIKDIVHNIQSFNRPNIKMLNLDFPEGQAELKTPDRIFIGGGGRHLERIIPACCDRLSQQGVIVINTVVIQNMETALDILTKKGFSPELIQIQVSRSAIMPNGHRLTPLNPVWIISGSKPSNKAV